MLIKVDSLFSRQRPLQKTTTDQNEDIKQPLPAGGLRIFTLTQI